MQKEYINIHTHNSESAENELAIVNLFADKSHDIPKSGTFSLGLHPWHIKDCNYYEVLSQLKIEAKKSNIIAIGEAGLDKNVDIDYEIQKEIFIKQVLIAEENSIPVIIHCVRYFNEIIEMKKLLNPKSQWIIHGFNNNPQIAESLLKHGFYLSFGKHLFIEESNSQNTLKITPLNKIFLENDESEFSIKEIYNKASDIKGVDHKSQIRENFDSIFGRSVIHCF